MGVCLICLAWAALWLQTPYGRVLNVFGMGRPMAAAVGRMLNMLGMGRPADGAALCRMCLICLALATLWLRKPHGTPPPVAAAAIRGPGY